MIDKQAMFAVKFAKNLLRYPVEEQAQVLEQLSPKGAALVVNARQLVLSAAKKRNK